MTGLPSSLKYIQLARPICLRLFVHLIAWAFALALLSAGRSMPAKMAIIAITTSSSIKVKPDRGSAASVLFIGLVIGCVRELAGSMKPMSEKGNGILRHAMAENTARWRRFALPPSTLGFALRAGFKGS